MYQHLRCHQISKNTQPISTGIDKLLLKSLKFDQIELTWFLF